MDRKWVALTLSAEGVVCTLVPSQGPVHDMGAVLTPLCHDWVELSSPALGCFRLSQELVRLKIVTFLLEILATSFSHTPQDMDYRMSTSLSIQIIRDLSVP